MSKSTTGRWTITYDPESGQPIEVVSAEDYDHRVAFLASDGNVADARLLAAAPVLLATLKDLITEWYDGHQGDPFWEAALVAIARAEGRP